MTLTASAGLAELRYALLPSLSVLGAAETATGCSVCVQLIALVGMMLAASAGLAELRYALLTSLSVLGAAEAATGCSRDGSLLCSQSGRSREASMLQLLASSTPPVPQPRLSFRSRVSGGLSCAP